jgi:hypothetical protein
MDWILSFFGVWILSIVWAIITSRFSILEKYQDGGIALLSFAAGGIAGGFVTVGLNADIGLFILLILGAGCGAVAFSSHKIGEMIPVTHTTTHYHLYDNISRRYKSPKYKELRKLVKKSIKQQTLLIRDDYMLKIVISEIEFWDFTENLPFINQAIEIIQNQQTLANIAQNAKYKDTFDRALQKITDQLILSSLVRHITNDSLPIIKYSIIPNDDRCKKVIQKIENIELLETIWSNGTNQHVRETVCSRLGEIMKTDMDEVKNKLTEPAANGT